MLDFAILKTVYFYMQRLHASFKQQSSFLSKQIYRVAKEISKLLFLHSFMETKTAPHLLSAKFQEDM